jgi:hypothetical protein
MNRVKNVVDSLQGRQMGVTPSVDRFLLEHGYEQIKEFITSRNFLSPLLTGTIGILSPSFKRKNNGNPLYHLKVLIKTERTSLSLEKNGRISISKSQMNKGYARSKLDCFFFVFPLRAGLRPSSCSRKCGAHAPHFRLTQLNFRGRHLTYKKK